MRGRGKNHRGAEGAEEEKERTSLEFGSSSKINVVECYVIKVFEPNNETYRVTHQPPIMTLASVLLFEQEKVN